jgi:hypothetical protein
MLEFTTQNTREHIAHLLSQVITDVLNPARNDQEAARTLAKASALMDTLLQTIENQELPRLSNRDRVPNACADRTRCA